MEWDVSDEIWYCIMCLVLFLMIILYCLWCINFKLKFLWKNDDENVIIENCEI